MRQLEKKFPQIHHVFMASSTLNSFRGSCGHVRDCLWEFEELK